MMNSTNFANSKRRVIRMGSRGGFYIAKGDGEKKYNPVARFRKASDGSMTKLTKTNLPNVPEAIRPARAAGKAPSPTPLAPANARRARMNAMAAKRAAGAMPAPRRRARATTKPRGRKPMSNSAKASQLFTAMVLNKPARKVRKNKGVARKPKSGSAEATRRFAKILNKQVAPPKAKVAAKNVIIVSPGGTLYKSKRSEMALKRARAQKKLRKQNPFAALNNALMR